MGTYVIRGVHHAQIERAKVRARDRGTSLDSLLLETIQQWATDPIPAPVAISIPPFVPREPGDLGSTANMPQWLRDEVFRLIEDHAAKQRTPPDIGSDVPGGGAV